MIVSRRFASNLFVCVCVCQSVCVCVCVCVKSLGSARDHTISKLQSGKISPQYMPNIQNNSMHAGNKHKFTHTDTHTFTHTHTHAHTHTHTHTYTHTQIAKFKLSSFLVNQGEIHSVTLQHLNSPLKPPRYFCNSS